MVVRGIRASFVLILWLVCIDAGAQSYGPVPVGLGFPSPFAGIAPWDTVGSADVSHGFYQNAAIRKYINSFVSYQFPNPFPPYQDPLSRLEFPFDQWFLELGAGFGSTWWSIHGRGSINVSTLSALKMQDSDWDDENAPFQKTIFSESKCRLDRGYTADVWLEFAGLGAPFDWLAPLVGYRHQYFRFTTYDGVQGDITGTVYDLPGNGIEYEQIFDHFYAGAVLRRSLVFGTQSYTPTVVDLSVQFDVGTVRGRNEDLHLLRAGERITRDDTKGISWHVGVATSCRISNRLKAKLMGDFLRVETKGTHNLTNPVFGIDFTFDGARVWSDQASIAAALEIAF